MPTHYTVSQTAKLLGTSTATVRRMADDMADILPDYLPLSGQARRFSDNDVKTLSALHTRLQADITLTRSALLAELSRPDSEPLIVPDTLPAASPQDAPDSTLDRIAIQTTSPLPDTALQPFLQAQNATQRQLVEISALIEKLSGATRDFRPARPVDIAALLSVGVLIVSLTVSALIQWPIAGVAGCAVALFILVWGLVSPSMRR